MMGECRNGGNPRAILMGSDSDGPKINKAAAVLDEFVVEYDVPIVQIRAERQDSQKEPTIAE